MDTDKKPIAHWYNIDNTGAHRMELCVDDTRYFIWSADEQQHKNIPLWFAKQCWDEAAEQDRGQRPE